MMGEGIWKNENFDSRFADDHKIWRGGMCGIFTGFVVLCRNRQNGEIRKMGENLIELLTKKVPSRGSCI